jgi:8-oxo-dGTP pyrophosphatase MutT (NUDIX family)
MREEQPGGGLLEAIRRVVASYQPRRIQPEGRPEAAVLLPIYEVQGEPHILFTLRTHLVETHKGQISFPGGAADPEDDDLRLTALRETYEELGVRPEDVEVVGELDDWPSISGFMVTPYVGFIHGPAPYPFRPSRHEVAELIEVPLSHLMDRANVTQEVRHVDARDVVMYSYLFRGHVIWGLTARILKQFLDLLASTVVEPPR